MELTTILHTKRLMTTAQYNAEQAHPVLCAMLTSEIRNLLTKDQSMIVNEVVTLTPMIPVPSLIILGEFFPRGVPAQAYRLIE